LEIEPKATGSKKSQTATAITAAAAVASIANIIVNLQTHRQGLFSPPNSIFPNKHPSNHTNTWQQKQTKKQQQEGVEMEEREEGENTVLDFSAH
jgi:hypothetical protein